MEPGAAAIDVEEMLIAEHTAAVRDLLAVPVADLERVGNGRNSRVYRVRSTSGEYAAKFYFHRTADGRDRSSVEFSALQFMWRHGLRCVPRAIAVDGERQLAIYEFVDGQTLEAAEATAGDVDVLVEFLRSLKKLAARPESSVFTPAAEACFAIDEVVANIQTRYERMVALDVLGPSYEALRKFLCEDFYPALEQFAGHARTRYFDRAFPLPIEHRTLSPSDLGFHNALRRSDGVVVFLDFEYFGWDDPAKTLSDALWHPRMQLSDGMKTHLARQFAAVFDADDRWRARLEAVHPLFGLKWCMILLNEFKPEQLQRRRFIDREPEEVVTLQMRQLDAARTLLRHIFRQAKHFPFW